MQKAIEEDRKQGLIPFYVCNVIVSLYLLCSMNAIYLKILLCIAMFNQSTTGHIYIYMYLCIIYVCIHMYVCIYIYVCMDICAHMCMVYIRLFGVCYRW